MLVLILGYYNKKILKNRHIHRQTTAPTAPELANADVGVFLLSDITATGLKCQNGTATGGSNTAIAMPGPVLSFVCMLELHSAYPSMCASTHMGPFIDAPVPSFIQLLTTADSEARVARSCTLPGYRSGWPDWLVGCLGHTVGWLVDE